MDTHLQQFLKEALFAGDPDFISSDPEFAEFFSEFAFGEVFAQCDIPNSEGLLAILAALVGCQGHETFRRIVRAVSSGSLKHVGLRPLQIREMLYQAAAYVGIGRMQPFLEIFDEAVREAQIHLPIVKSGTVNSSTRLSAGEEAQAAVFGEGMKGFAQSGPEESRHINRWLTANCFGDYYTRKGLDLRHREMITFCFLMGQGGCEPQLTAHAGANMRIGNSREYLISILSLCVPFIGYPRVLNALGCVNKAAESVS